MALAATTVWEVRTAGSDTLCSGGYVAGGGGTDFSQQNAAQYTGTNLVIDGATNTKVTSATHNFVAADVGNLMQITAGSGFTTGFFQIVSVAANAATLDRSAGTLGSTAGTFAVGGALATPGLAIGSMVAGNVIYAAGGYTTTTDTANVAGGRMHFNANAAYDNYRRFIGYTTARGDGGKYTVTLGAALVGPVLRIDTNYNDIRNLAIVGNATASAYAMLFQGGIARVVNLKVSNFSAAGQHTVWLLGNSYSLLKDFEISGGNTGTNAALYIGGTCNVMDGWVHGNAGRGVILASATAVGLTRVISAEHTGANGHGFWCNDFEGATFTECAAWNNAQDDWHIVAAQGFQATFVRCVSGGGAGYNWNNLYPDSCQLYYCASKANTSGLFQTTPNVNVGMVTLTGDPWTNRTAGDFSPDNTANEGAVLRGVAETIFSLTTSYADIGPAQHQDAGGGAGGTGPNVIVSSGAGSRGGSW